MPPVNNYLFMHSKLFDPFIKEKGLVILDGAMATELEKKGADLNHALWSARLLSENPKLIKEVHLDYLYAGADIITTAGYQASFTGFAREGYSKERSAELFQLSVRLAFEAREEFLRSTSSGTAKPLVAASVGPYGASLADGSEYRGNYGLSVQDLMDFHREQISVLAEAEADLLAFETIPCLEEAEAIILLLNKFPHVKAWISFSCKNATETCSGDSFALAVALANNNDQVVASGVNCTAPHYVESLVGIAAKASKKPVLAYPNKGEVWDAENKCWLPGDGKSHDFTENARRWQNAGALLIGGCCRTTPEDIRSLKSSFSL